MIQPLWRVDYWEGFGFPKCERRERRTVIFRNLDSAKRLLAVIERMPDHHALIGTYESEVTWHETTITAAAVATPPSSEPSLDSSDHC